ncbi:phosphoglycolate phosphatase [Kineothrix alysoides]|uniref:Phosphoglycolate phosphatase n=1 Tax=Kineothrix alysoides TaxID=1469948 RepID=A0A4R1R4N3_9FIRM|nr:HAD hydrolase-like protein [Kineothrix alysoides]TCL60419.1 phosphoglycolate phosphatase [Kineothrix alysoides]
MKYKYLLFDLDGTLTDPKEGITTSVQYALKSFGIDEPDLDKLEPFIGPPLKDSFIKYYGLDEEQAETAIVKYREWFSPTGIFQNKIYPGTEDMLAALKNKEKVLAVASSKPTVFVEKILNHFEIRQYFDVVVGSELNGVRGSKEEVVEEALRQLSAKCADDKDAAAESGEAETVQREMVAVAETIYIDKEHTAMIGDREFDVFGGKQHGLTTVGVTFGYAGEGELEAAGADYIVNTVEELRRLLIQ